jgi:predicted kinase
MRLRDRNLPPAVRAEVEHRARRFFMLALAFARQMRPPALIALTGLMGSGKSRLAGELSARTGIAVLASDAIRKERAAGGEPVPVRDRSPFGAGLYSADWTARTYGELFARAAALLGRGHPVILDASFSRQAQRDAAFALARQAGAEPWLVECRVPDEVALERLRRREAEGTATSDGRAELYPAQKAAFEQVVGLPPGRHLTVDRSRPAEENAVQVLAAPGLAIPEPLFTLPPEIKRRLEDEGSPS